MKNLTKWKTSMPRGNIVAFIPPHPIAHQNSDIYIIFLPFWEFFLGCWWCHSFYPNGRDGILKVLRKNTMTAVAYVMEMLLEPLVSKQLPKPLLSNDPIMQCFLIIALFQMRLAMWLMKTHGWKWTKVTLLTLIHFKWLQREKFNPFLRVTQLLWVCIAFSRFINLMHSF